MRIFETTAQAELWIAEGRIEAALELLRGEMAREDNLVGIFLETVCHAAAACENDIDRQKFIEMGKSQPVPNRLRFNVPVQVNRARVAILARDEKLFDNILNDLAKTKIDREEIERLKQQWAAGF